MKVKRKVDKIDIFYVSVLLISLCIMIAGATLAYFSASVSQEEDSTKVYSGTLVINYLDGIEVSNPKLQPRYAPSGISDITNTYTNKFGVESKGSLDQTISVIFTVNSNEFASGMLKYAVYNESGNLVRTGNLPASGDVEIIGNTFLASGHTSYYTFMVWLDETGTNQNSEQGKTFTGKMTVNAMQVKNVK